MTTDSTIAAVQRQFQLAQENYQRVAAQKLAEETKEVMRVQAEAQAMTEVLKYIQTAIADRVANGGSLKGLTQALLDHPGIENPDRAFLELVYDLLVQPVLGLRQGAEGLSWKLLGYASVPELHQAILDHLGVPSPFQTSRWIGRLLEAIAISEDSKGMIISLLMPYTVPLTVAGANTLGATGYLSKYGLTEW